MLFHVDGFFELDSFLSKRHTYLWHNTRTISVATYLLPPAYTRTHLTENKKKTRWCSRWSSRYFHLMRCGPTVCCPLRTQSSRSNKERWPDKKLRYNLTLTQWVATDTFSVRHTYLCHNTNNLFPQKGGFSRYTFGSIRKKKWLD